MCKVRNLSVKLHTIRGAFSKEYFVFSFDLKSRYRHIDIFPDHCRYLAFSWDFGSGHTRYFQFTVLLFGLSSAPFIFTKLLKSLESHWRAQGIPIDIFFDHGMQEFRWRLPNPIVLWFVLIFRVAVLKFIM